MKIKALSLLAAAILLLSFAAALAEPVIYRMIEDFEEFDFEVEIPDGAFYKQNFHDGWLCMEIWFEDASKPWFDINIAFCDVVESRFLADFTQEETGFLLETAGGDFSAPTHEFFDTPSGNTILLTRESDPEAGGYATMITVYKGFFFSLYCARQGYSALTDEDLALMHQIIEGAWIIDTGR